MRIPTKTECYQLIYEMGMLDHIVAHSFRVCQIATYLADHMTRQNIPLNRDLVHTSALLHDITKTRSIKTGEKHALTGARILNEMGYPEVGSIIGQHVRLNNYSFSTLPEEAEIVYYADKRVLHDKVVPLQDRMEYILKRYGSGPERRRQIRVGWIQTEKLEDKLFRYLSFAPEELNAITSKNRASDFFAYRASMQTTL
jgi:uncharacterized protein